MATTPLIASLGLGVDSSSVVAAIAARHPLYADFADRQLWILTSDLEVELPETYDFRDNYLGPFLAERGYTIEILTPQVRDRFGAMHSNLADYYYRMAAVPARATRACTERFKVLTVQGRAKEEFGDTPLDVLIGFDVRETGRADRLASYTGQFNYLFPMIQRDVSRLRAAALLLSLGLPVPRRSACFCCPFSRTQDWWELSWRHPHLYQAAVEMEQNVVRERGRTFYFSDKPLAEGATPRLFKLDKEAQRLYEAAQRYLARISPAWPSYALSLAARDLYGETWPEAVGALKLGPARLEDPWQIYIRLQYCLEMPDKVRREWGEAHRAPLDLPLVASKGEGQTRFLRETDLPVKKFDTKSLPL